MYLITVVSPNREGAAPAAPSQLPSSDHATFSGASPLFTDVLTYEMIPAF
jgi:hypothetical protein